MTWHKSHELFGHSCGHRARQEGTHFRHWERWDRQDLCTASQGMSISSLASSKRALCTKRVVAVALGGEGGGSCPAWGPFCPRERLRFSRSGCKPSFGPPEIWSSSEVRYIN